MIHIQNYEENKNKSGIYQIRNIINNKIYIGSTINKLRRRKDYHFNHLIKNFDYFFCPSSWQKECMVRQGWDENKVFIVPEGVDKNLLPINNKKYLQSSHKFRFFLTGRWEYRKSTTEIISSFLKEN